MQEPDALLRACKYSLQPNSLGFCGPKEAEEKFKGFIAAPLHQKDSEIKSLLQQFSALFPYLELIANSNALDPFDPKVVEAYWLGNSLLENVEKRELQKTILSFQLHGLPREKAEEKASVLKEGMLPHHSLHVLFINFLNPKVKPLLENLSSCLVSWGKVLEVEEDFLKVSAATLFYESGELKLREKQAKAKNPFALAPSNGGFVSLHWGTAIEELESDQLKSLQRFSKNTLSLIQP